VSLAEALSLTQELGRRSEASILPYLQWLPGQLAFLQDPSKAKLARWGNQWGGKTTVGLSEVIYRCRGYHPYIEVPQGPIEAWVLCASWPQSVSIQGKLNDLLDPDEVDWSVTRLFDQKNGFGAKSPMVKLKNGSIIRFRTTQQGGLNLAGATIDVALFDEPPASQRVFSEVQKRLMRQNGVLLMTLTPINAPTDWLKDYAERGQIADHHYRLSADNLIPVGEEHPLLLADGTPMNDDWIQEVIQQTLAHEVPVVLHGEWECRVQGRYFAAFSDVAHVSDELPQGKVQLRFGVDHGDGRNFSQAAYLCAVRTGEDHDHVWVLDEYIADGSTTSRQDAAGVWDMLRRNGMGWHSIDKAHGDRSWAGKQGATSRKDNAKLMQELSRMVGAAGELRPRIKTVKRGQGRGRHSIDAGGRYLHQLMVTPGAFTVHPRCERLIQSLNRWDYTDSEWKHAIDALRYALDDRIFARVRVGNGEPLYLYG
jgi:phage terminase large subunit-like protein